MSRRQYSIWATGVCLSGLFGLATVSQAAILVDYTAVAPATSPADPFAPSTIDPNLTATSLAPHDSNVTIPVESNGYPTGTGLSGSPEYRYIPNTNVILATDAASAVSNNAYISFVLTANAGKALNLTSLTFNVARGGAATPRGIVVRTSADNFTNNLVAQDITTQRTTYTFENLDLTAAQYQNLPSIEIRYYAYTPGTGQSLDTDDIIVNGSVVPAPEPASVGIFAVAGLGALLRRRRR